jgi:NAD(P)H-quinone oxidoreductase subunit 5
MTGQDTPETVGALPNVASESSRTPVVLTRFVWLLWAGSLAALGARVLGRLPEFPGLLVVDGLTVVMWVAVTGFSGIVHSYARRYMAGSRDIDRFFRRVFAFTLVVMLLVAADHLVLFVGAWLAMGLLMSDLIGFVRGWPQARAAGRTARRYFLASGGLLAAGVGVLWWTTGATTVSGVTTALDGLPREVTVAAAGLLLLAAMVQSALVPFHTWLRSSMTAPTPASALMHAGFVNAGGILLARFAPLVADDLAVATVVVVAGAVSALVGKLLKSLQPDIKGQLSFSTTAQMGFMILQAGLGFFAAAITHLILHGCYKAYLFLSSGEAVERTAPDAESRVATGLPGLAVAGLTAVAGAALFAALTGKGTSLDSGFLLTLFVGATGLHAARDVARHAALPAAVRYGAVPLIALPAIALYAVVYEAVVGLMAGGAVAEAPTELTVVHGVVAIAFLVAYVAVELDLHEHSTRLYVALLNLSQPTPDTVLTSTEEYNEY